MEIYGNVRSPASYYAIRYSLASGMYHRAKLTETSFHHASLRLNLPVLITISAFSLWSRLLVYDFKKSTAVLCDGRYNPIFWFLNF